MTINAQPDVARWATPVTLSGSVASGKAEELVTIQVKECGRHAPFFRSVAAVRTNEGGTWSTPFFVRTTSAFRATWGEAASVDVTVRQRPGVQLNHLSRNRFEVAVGALVPFVGKRVAIERFNRQLGTWVGVKSVRLTESGAGGSFAWSTARFRSALPKGTLMRAVFSRAQAQPCYVAGYSNLVRT